VPRRAIVYRLMIGSPSDPGSEREAATQVISEWNVQHAKAEGVVLLPVKWETHATPTTALRPQAAINEHLVDRCDIFIGMFWTRLGSMTGVAVSGTVEEIDRFVEAGKPTLLYFSNRKVSPAKADTSQAAKLRIFKAATRKKGAGRFICGCRRPQTSVASGHHATGKSIAPREEKRAK